MGRETEDSRSLFDESQNLLSLTCEPSIEFHSVELSPVGLTAPDRIWIHKPNIYVEKEVKFVERAVKRRSAEHFKRQIMRHKKSMSIVGTWWFDSGISVVVTMDDGGGYYFDGVPE